MLEKLLSKAEFNEGLVAGVPQNITVAHKFGERNFNNQTFQLHDCGVIYAKRPYLLCIMTKGPDFKDLSSAIKQISSKVYTEFTSKYP